MISWRYQELFKCKDDEWFLMFTTLINCKILIKNTWVTLKDVPERSGYIYAKNSMNSTTANFDLFLIGNDKSKF